MKKAQEYKEHAAACLALAERMHTAEERAQLEKMAKVWEELAVQRVRRQSSKSK